MGLAQYRLIEGKGLSKVMESIYAESSETGLAQSEDASPKALTSPNQSSISTNPLKELLNNEDLKNRFHPG